MLPGPEGRRRATSARHSPSPRGEHLGRRAALPAAGAEPAPAAPAARARPRRKAPQSLRALRGTVAAAPAARNPVPPRASGPRGTRPSPSGTPGCEAPGIRLLRLQRRGALTPAIAAGAPGRLVGARSHGPSRDGAHLVCQSQLGTIRSPLRDKICVKNRSDSTPAAPQTHQSRWLVAGAG